MVVLLFLTVGSTTLVKASMSKGMSNYVFAAYSNLLGFCFLLIATTLHYRNRSPTPLNNFILFRIFLIGFFRYANIETLNALFRSLVILVFNDFVLLLAFPFRRFSMLDLDIAPRLSTQPSKIFFQLSLSLSPLFSGLFPILFCYDAFLNLLDVSLSFF